MEKLLKRVWKGDLVFPEGRRGIVVDTINAHSYNVARTNKEFYNALLTSEILLPDGVGIVLAYKMLYHEKINKIAGWDYMVWELERLNKIGGKCFFLGSSNSVLEKIEERVKVEYPNVQLRTFSPPYKSVFTDEDNDLMINEVNSFSPDVLFVGMTAPKQESWISLVSKHIDAGHIGAVGACFDFYAGTVERAPKWVINMGLEWLYRLIREPKRMFQRYVVGNPEFIINVLKIKIKGEYK